MTMITTTARFTGKSSTPNLESSLTVAQAQPRTAEYAPSRTNTQLLDTMQQQGWHITCPPDSVTPLRVCAVMVGKLSRHSR
jgi:hypothetical protein